MAAEARPAAALPFARPSGDGQTEPCNAPAERVYGSNAAPARTAMSASMAARPGTPPIAAPAGAGGRETRRVKEGRGTKGDTTPTTEAERGWGRGESTGGAG